MLMLLDNVPSMCVTASNWFLEIIFFVEMFFLKWDWIKNLAFMRFYINWFVAVIYGCFNGFLMIVELRQTC